MFLLTLDSARTIRAVEYHQAYTYEGGLAIGKHSRERNERMIKSCCRFAKKIHSACPVEIVVPHECPEESAVECLPFLTCYTWWISDPIHDPMRGGSHLCTIHFQDERSLYVAPAVVNEIQSIDWEAVAEDFDY